METGKPTESAQSRPLLWHIAIGLILVAVYYAPLPATAASLIYDWFTLSAVAAIVWATRRRRPSAPRAWWLLAAGIALLLAGDLCWDYYELILAVEPPFPSIADALYLAAFPSSARPSSSSAGAAAGAATAGPRSTRPSSVSATPLPPGTSSSNPTSSTPLTRSSSASSPPPTPPPTSRSLRPSPCSSSLRTGGRPPSSCSVSGPPSTSPLTCFTPADSSPAPTPAAPRASVINLLHDPDVRGLVVNSRDITARNRADAALRAAQTLNASVSVKGMRPRSRPPDPVPLSS